MDASARNYDNDGGPLFGPFSEELTAEEIEALFVSASFVDCNFNGVDDQSELGGGIGSDADGDGLLDECESVLGDVDGDGDIDESDGTELSLQMGLSEGDPGYLDSADLDGDRAITVADADLWAAAAVAADLDFDCADVSDNDGDGEIDFPHDPGCFSLTTGLEDPQCDDAIDNDGDGVVDFPADPQCVASWDNRERSGTCGLLGIEGLLWVAAVRLRRASRE
jgi:hypothetical protein